MKFVSSFFRLKNRLTSIGENQPLHFFSLLIILALDIFVLINIFQGLHMQTSQITSPHEAIPYSCSQYLPKDEELTKEEKIDALYQALKTESYFSNVNNKYASAVEIIEERNKSQVDERCREIFSLATKVNTSEEIRVTRQEIQNMEKTISSWESENFRYRETYDTVLLEEIAQQDEADSLVKGNIGTVKKRMEENAALINNLEREISKNENRMLAQKPAQEFIFAIAENSEGIKKTQSWLSFWYPLKNFIVQMLFLLPLFFFFWWVYRKMSAKKSSTLSLVFAHLFVVSSIPIVLKFFTLLLGLLPFHFFADLLDLLEALNVIALWNYILIALAVSLVLGLIYFLQKKVFSVQKIWERRTEKGECWACGKKVNEKDDFCAFCGENQKRVCDSCKEKTPIKLHFCVRCGAPESLEE